jgi:hypothetical protein
MKLPVVTDVLGLAGITAWVGFSGYFAAIGDGEFFQRMGSFGVAVGIIYFALVRHGTEFPLILRDRLKSLRRTQHLHTQHIEGAYRNAGLVAHELANLRSELKLPKSDAASGLSAALVEGLKKEPLKAIELDSRFEKVDLAEEDAANLVALQKRFSQMFEVWVVVIATLQWGFGDLLFASVCEANC